MTAAPTIAAAAAVPPAPQSDVRRSLRLRLLALDFPAFAQCVGLLLARMGYADVRLAGSSNSSRPGTRTGRSRLAVGYDLTAFLPVGPYRRPVAVCLRQFDTEPVYQRMVDELRGVCLRTGAAEGVLVTTGSLASTVQRDQAQNSPLCPVRLLDGETLLDLLLLHKVGVRVEPPSRIGAPERHRIDTAFFDTLESRQPKGKAKARDKAAGQRCQGTRSPRLLVSVRFEPPLLPGRRSGKSGVSVEVG